MKGSKKQPETSALSVPGVDLNQLERLLSFMTEHGLEEFEYAHGDLRIRLKKAYPAPAVGSSQVLPAPQAAGAAALPAPPTAADLSPQQTQQAAPAPAPVEDLHTIKSPIVGTFYRGPNPEAEPFVKLGDLVEAGQTICIIEAMKLMNEIEADISGEITRILVGNGEPVEYGEPLFALRPAAKNK
jgi:acetyl-CoA carboxylase biotin carboxyl carrier protein